MSGHATFTYKVFQEKEQYRRECEAKDKEIASLKAQLKREVDCVDFYAEKENWGRMEMSDECIELDYEKLHPKRKMLITGGKLARETVKAREI